MSGVQFGATYTLDPLGTKAMSNVVSADSVAEYDAHYHFGNLIRKYNSKIRTRTWCISKHLHFKVVGTEKYLGAVSNTNNNYLRQLVDKDYIIIHH